MTQPSIFEPTVLHPEQISAKKPWDRQDGESAKWYWRFRNYLNLGPRRAINAVYEAEQQEKATKSRGKAGETWYNAAKRYQWKTRAESYDRDQDERKALIMKQIAMKCAFVSRPFRIAQLNMLADGLMRTTEEGCDSAIFIAVCRQTQSLMADIREEIDAWGVTIDASCDAAALDQWKQKNRRLGDLAQERELDLDAEIDRQMAKLATLQAMISRGKALNNELGMDKE